MKNEDDLPLAFGREEAAAYVGISTATMHRLITRGDFPAPRKVGDRRVVWLRREIEAWLESRPVSDLLPPPSRKSK